MKQEPVTWKSWRINLVISNISINFVHNYYKPTEDAVHFIYEHKSSEGKLKKETQQKYDESEFK